MLSVIVPTHNRATLLERCLAGLAAQDDADFEAVVAVDGSTDGTVALLESVRRRASFPLEVLLLERGGQARARNHAMRRARGDVLVFCDDDVVLGAGALARHAAFHQVFPRSVAIGPVTYEGGRTQFPARPGWVNFTGMNSSVPREAALEAGGFDEDLSGYGGEDLEFAYRLHEAGVRFRRLPGATATHLGPWTRGVEKARSAGEQAVKVAAKHGSAIAWQLGVHPALLAVKRAYLNPATALVLRGSRSFEFERAYLEGAVAARRELDALEAEASGGDERGESERGNS